MPVHPKNYVYNCNSYINIIHNQIDNYYSVCLDASLNMQLLDL